MLLLCHKLEFTAGKIISLELVTLCCVSLFRNSQIQPTRNPLQMAGEVANYFIISIQLFVDNPNE